MAAKTSVAKKSVRPNKRTSKRVPQSKKSQPLSPKSRRESQLAGEDAAALPLDSPPSLAERIQAERERIFKALSLVLCCKYATVTKWQVDDSEYMIPAFEAICDLIDTSAEELEKIASQCASLA